LVSVFLFLSSQFLSYQAHLDPTKLEGLVGDQSMQLHAGLRPKTN
jgi:hypothetical protein